MEAVYLARRGRFVTLVINRDPSSPALSLADKEVIVDVVEKPGRAAKIIRECDAVLPVCEDWPTLNTLSEICKNVEVPLIFDSRAYSTVSSKLKSNAFMRRLGIPTPKPWPESNFPVIIEPSNKSRITDASRATNADELIRERDRIVRTGILPLVREYVNGSSISIDVIGDGRGAVPLAISEKVFDTSYECNVVYSPWGNNDTTIEKQFVESSFLMASELRLFGTMSVKAVVCNGTMKVIDIDARYPEQTPITVLHSNGINILEDLVDMTINGRLMRPQVTSSRVACCEYVAVKENTLLSSKEGHLSEISKPKVIHGLFGSDEMITDYEPGKRSWIGLIICTGATHQEVRRKRKDVLKAILELENISNYSDLPSCGVRSPRTTDRKASSVHSQK